jgi:hypothetical protein
MQIALKYPDNDRENKADSTVLNRPTPPFTGLFPLRLSEHI